MGLSVMMMEIFYNLPQVTFRPLRCGYSVTEELRLSFYFILINLNLNSHRGPLATILDKAILKESSSKEMKLECKSEFGGKCRVQVVKAKFPI